MDLSLEYGASNPQSHNNIALDFGFDASVVVWSQDGDVRAEIARLLGLARDMPEIGGKSLAGLDLSGEKPFDLHNAKFEDLDMQGLKLPSGTNFSNARFIGCNLYGVNLSDCVMEE